MPHLRHALMLSFLPGFEVFAIAGLIAAAGPVIIHLLNRRRFRVLNWAAMDFLLEALQRNRRMLRLRDLLLLLLRTACLVLFGLAIARPFFSHAPLETGPDSAVHAVLLVDNSLSMGYQQLDESTLDLAKEKALRFVDKLPEGSRVSVIPACGSAFGYSLDAMASREDAADAIEKIEVVDRSVNGNEIAAMAVEASDMTAGLAKRVVLLGDQQRGNWAADAAASWKQIGDLQVASVRPHEAENTWISEFTLQDAIADVESMTAFTAVVRHEGDAPRSGVQVTLAVDGVDVATRTVDLQPGQHLPVTFKYQFDVAVAPGRPKFVPASVSLTPDRLPQDDQRFLVVPVVAALPVLFIDQYGEGETKDKRGETRPLRAWLAPKSSRHDTTRHLVQIRQATVEQLRREMLEDVRLVVMAGVPDPAPGVDLLREYVQQGGQLLIFAGGNPHRGEFDPAAWQRNAWLDGNGILPLPLESQPVGQRQDEMEVRGEKSDWFQLDFETLWHDYFVLPGESKEDLAALYASAYFFKAVRADSSDEIIADLLAAETDRLAENLRFLVESDQRIAHWLELEAAGKLEDQHREAWQQDERRRAEIRPDWLRWENPRTRDLLADRPDEEAQRKKIARAIAERNRPRVLARLTGGVPFVVQRGIDRGRVVFVSSGVMPVEWNTVAGSDAVVVYGRMMRSLLESTLPERNVDSSQEITLPIRAGQRRERFILQRPGDGPPEDLYPEALGPNRFGLIVRNVTRRGIYRVIARPTATSAAAEDAERKLWEIPLAVNGPEAESHLLMLNEEDFGERMAAPSETAETATQVRWVDAGDDLRLEGASVSGEDLWWWLMLAALALLLVEMAILARPYWKGTTR